jgi:DNA invertase Pin-like site-specific DNA recombinase
MAEGKFISYLRVSTDKQGRSGLGIEAQREAVVRYLNGGQWTLSAEYVETESGRRSDRPKLAAALSHAKAIGAKLLREAGQAHPQRGPATVAGGQRG